MASRDGLYLLHIEPRYQHAGHYLGWAADITERLRQHLNGHAKSSPLVRAALAAGCEVELVRCWPRLGRTDERRLKRQGGLSRHCPTCRARGPVH